MEMVELCGYNVGAHFSESWDHLNQSSSSKDHYQITAQQLLMEYSETKKLTDTYEYSDSSKFTVKLSWFFSIARYPVLSLLKYLSTLDLLAGCSWILSDSSKRSHPIISHQ